MLGVVGTLDRLLECFGRYRWVFALHVFAEGLFLGAVPGALTWVCDDAVLGDQVVEVLGQPVRDDDVGRIQPVQRVAPPAEEKELPVQQAQGHAGHLLLLGRLAVVEEIPGPAFCCRLDGDKAFSGHGLEGAGDDLPRLVWELGADFPEFGNVQITQRAAAE
ncbi:hypothetical protein D3C87_1703500 [compost metagenome]